jgi:hypothetical protein
MLYFLKIRALYFSLPPPFASETSEKARQTKAKRTKAAASQGLKLDQNQMARFTMSSA